MDLSKPETDLLLEAMDHALEGHIDGDDEETGDLAYTLMQRLRDHRDASEVPERPAESRYELFSGCPGLPAVRITYATDSPLQAVKDFLSVMGRHNNIIGEMITKDQDGETVYHFPIHLGWPVLVKAIC